MQTPNSPENPEISPSDPVDPTTPNAAPATTPTTTSNIARESSPSLPSIASSDSAAGYPPQPAAESNPYRIDATDAATDAAADDRARLDAERERLDAEHERIIEGTLVPLPAWSSAPYGVGHETAGHRSRRARPRGLGQLIGTSMLSAALASGLTIGLVGAIGGSGSSASTSTGSTASTAAVVTTTTGTTTGTSTTAGTTTTTGSTVATTGSSTASSDALVSAVAAVSPAVVTIQTSITTTGFGPGGQGTASGTGTGSGFIYSSDGYILTNAHVIEGATSITVTLADGRTFTGTVVKSDTTADLAVVKIDGTGLPTAGIGSSSSLKLGQTVLAIGDPLGEFEGTVTVGIVSGTNRTITVADELTRASHELSGLIQTDAAINSGNSGGPLIDSTGKVIGIVTAGSTSAEGIGFAIPIDSALSIMAQAKGTSA